VFAMFAVLNFTGTFGSSNAGKHLKEGLKTEIAENQKKVAALEVKRNLAVAAKQDVASLDKQIAKRKEDIADSQMALSGNFVQADTDNDTPGWLRPFLNNIRENPDAVSMKVQDAASKYSWLLIPISVPFMWMLFPFRRRYNTYDHMVFVTYSLSFMMMLVIAGGVLIEVGMSALAGFLFFVPPFQLWLRKARPRELHI